MAVSGKSWLLLTSLAALSHLSVYGQTPPAFSCSVAVSPVVARGEGRAELLGDIVIQCTGGTPAAAGVPVAPANIQIFVDSNVTGRLLADPWSEALLLIDDPLPANQLLCGAPSAPEISSGVCTITGNGTGQGLYDGSPGHPNVFQGAMAGSNSLIWNGVPIDPPAPGGTRTIRIMNVRVDAFSYHAPRSPVVPVNVTIGGSLPVSNPQVVPAIVEQSYQFQMSAAGDFQQCVSQNPDLLTNTSASAVPQLTLTFVGTQNGFLKPRTVKQATNIDLPPPIVDQNSLIPYPFSETGFFNHLFPSIQGRGSAAAAGLASQATRILAQFTNIPAGVQLFAPTSQSNVQAGGVLRMIQTNRLGAGPFVPVSGQLAPLQVNGTTQTAAFEVMWVNFLSYVADIPIYVAYVANAPTGPALGSARVAAGLAPWTASNTSTSIDPVPRFAPPATARAAFTIAACPTQCAPDARSQVIPGPITTYLWKAPNIFVQKVPVKNTGITPITGPLSLVMENLNPNVTFVNPTGMTSCWAPPRPYINVNLGSANVLNPGQQVVIYLFFVASTGTDITYNFISALVGSGPR